MNHAVTFLFVLLTVLCVQGRPYDEKSDIDREKLKLLAEKFIKEYRQGNIQLSQPSKIYGNHGNHQNEADHFWVNDVMAGQNDGQFTQHATSSSWFHFDWKEVPCELCKLAVGIIQEALIINATESVIVEELTKICIDLDIEDQRVCTSIIPLFKNEVLTVIDQVVLEPSQICGFAFGSDCGDTYDPYSMWYVTFPDVPKPPVKPHKSPQPGAPKLRILHISDIHVDMKYAAGTNTDCGEPLCCRANDGPVKGDPSGKWGDYRNCDLPPWTLENLFQHLAANETFDYVYWTGDLPAHNVWNQSRSDQLDVLQYITGLFRKYLPNAIIFPSCGNHESSPVNSFPPPYIQGNNSISWLYTPMSEAWKEFLPKNGSYEFLQTGAYYTVLLKPGFRVISVNTNYCNDQNWWMLINETDPAQELQWLVGVLQKAEDNNEKVHIIGHIPTGGCLKAWSWNYYNIINRYESTITGQFFGHTHHDHYAVYYDLPTLKRPVSMAYMGPSVTTYSYLNPAYRIYTADGFYSNSTWDVLDFDTYIMNITAANITNKPVWIKEYSAKEAYNLTTLFPEDWNNLIERMKTNSTLFDQFYNYYNKMVPTDPCDDTCRKNMLCELRTARADDPTLCKDLVDDFNEYKYQAYRKRKC